MKKNISLIIVAVAIGLFGFKTDGRVTTISPSVSPFEKIEIDTHMKTVITVREGAIPSLKLTASESELERIETKVVGDRLVVSSRPEHWGRDNSSEDVTAEIILPKFTGLEIHGSSPVKVHGDVTGNNFMLEISGSGHAVFDNMNVAKLVSEIAGSGHADIDAGTAAKAKYSISGSGKIRAFDLKSKEVSAEISGSGKCEVNVADKLVAGVSGSGSVIYTGDPATVDKEVSGSGSVRHAETTRALK